MIELVVIGVIGGIALVLPLWILIYKAMGNLVDWLILTFGNADAVEQLKRRRLRDHGGA